jgi:hypothetical protein
VISERVLILIKTAWAVGSSEVLASIFVSLPSREMKRKTDDDGDRKRNDCSQYKNAR